ncbi:TonB-dependent receptor domain-containing protein [Enterobacterales bacterium AN_CKDN230030167-1A_HGKHYDSX7]
MGTERINNAELGIKSTLLDQRLLLNTNLFWSEISGYQATAYDPAAFTSYLTNAGKVRSRGLEVDASLRLNRHLTLDGNASYNDVRYTDYKNAPCAPEVSLANGATSCDLTGASLPGASKWIFNLNGRYEWDQAAGLQPYATASYAFRYRTTGTLDNSDYGVIPSYAVVNLSTGVRGDFNDGTWDVSVWLKNAFDKTYYNYVAPSMAGSYSGYPAPPRTLGMTARYDF